jgi:hypothetical protein
MSELHSELKLAIVLSVFQQVESWMANGRPAEEWPNAVVDLYRHCKSIADIKPYQPYIPTPEEEERMRQ